VQAVDEGRGVEGVQQLLLQHIADHGRRRQRGRELSPRKERQKGGAGGKIVLAFLVSVQEGRTCIAKST
jgi:hypothetical protein